MEMFKGVVEISIKPFFNLSEGQEEGREGEGNKAQEIGEGTWGWRLVGKGEIRGPTV